jgi:hypothetical protein
MTGVDVDFVIFNVVLIWAQNGIIVDLDTGNSCCRLGIESIAAILVNGEIKF